jgi:hypothetical protein
MNLLLLPAKKKLEKFHAGLAALPGWTSATKA